MQHHSKETSASCVDIQAMLSACFSVFLLAVMTSFNSRSLAAEKKKKYPSESYLPRLDFGSAGPCVCFDM